MKNRAKLIATLAVAVLLLPRTSMAQSGPSEPRRADPVSESDVANPYRLFATANIWTFILLDTATGRAWQVNYFLDGTPMTKSAINESSLLPEGATPKNGRFTLYATNNMYNFLLLDRKDSRIWQLQWSLESENRGIIGSMPLP